MYLAFKDMKHFTIFDCKTFVFLLYDLKFFQPKVKTNYYFLSKEKKKRRRRRTQQKNSDLFGSSWPGCRLRVHSSQARATRQE